MNKFIENWCIGSGGTGTILSLTIGDIRDIISIVFISIQIIVLMIGILIKVEKALKNDGKIDNEEQEDIINDINNIKDKIDKGIDNDKKA